MHNAERLFGFVWIASLIGDIAGLPGGAFMLGIGTSFLAAFYFYAAVPTFLRLPLRAVFQFSIYSKIGGRDLIRMIFSGLALSSLIIGISLLQLGLDDSGIITPLVLGETAVVLILLSFPKAYQKAIYYKPALYRLLPLALALMAFNLV